MNLENLAYLAQIVGVVLVVASLVYVARQLQQNTEMLRSNSRQALLRNDQAGMDITMQNVELFEKLTKPERLSFQDQWRFSLLWIVDMRNREHEYLQYKAGVLDRETWDSYRQILRFSLGFERGRKWWRSVARDTFAPEFVKMVDEFVADIPKVDYIEALGTWE